VEQQEAARLKPSAPGRLPARSFGIPFMTPASLAREALSGSPQRPKILPISRDPKPNVRASGRQCFRGRGISGRHVLQRIRGRRELIDDSVQSRGNRPSFRLHSVSSALFAVEVRSVCRPVRSCNEIDPRKSHGYPPRLNADNSGKQHRGSRRHPSERRIFCNAAKGKMATWYSIRYQGLFGYACNR
jgi:hypothetical protein